MRQSERGIGVNRLGTQIGDPRVAGAGQPLLGDGRDLRQQGTAGNLPLAAAFSVVPIVLIGLYLMLARRLGAFDAL